MEDDEFYPISKVAKMFHVTKPTVHNWIRKGLFPHAFRMGEGEKSPWFIPKSDVKAYAQKVYGD